MANETASANHVNRLFIPAELDFLAPYVVEDLIRVGRFNDGGYVIPSASVCAANFLISCGISDDWSFEEHFRRINPEVKIHAYDHTVSSWGFSASAIRGLLKLPIGKTSFNNLSRRYTLLSSYKRFFKGDVQHFKERINCDSSLSCDITPTAAFKRTGSDKVFLKIDIEGDEYKIIEDLVAHSSHVVGMVIEFHSTNALRPLFVRSVQSLQRVYEIVHLHANNFASIGDDGLPNALEITLIRKSKLMSLDRRRRLPIPLLDSPNNPLKSDYWMDFV